MSDRIWKKGAPPHVGWWNASRHGWNADLWRWWDGKRWSLPVHEFSKSPIAKPGINLAVHEILWTDHWPAGARVPRLDSRMGPWYFNVEGKPLCRAFIDVRFSNGSEAHFTSVDECCWEIRGTPGDIVAWRPAA